MELFEGPAILRALEVHSASTNSFINLFTFEGKKGNPQLITKNDKSVSLFGGQCELQVLWDSQDLQTIPDSPRLLNPFNVTKIDLATSEDQKS